MNCPHCGLDTRLMTYQALEKIVQLHVKRYSPETIKLIWKVLSLTQNITRTDTLKFLARISKHTNKEIHYGLTKFFEKEMDKNGYEWQYAAGFIKREVKYYEQQMSKEQNNPLPKEG
jgi:hypothetical protein